MEIVLIAIIWVACGFAAWCACLAYFYEIRTRSPWGKDRRRAIPLAALVFVLGPIGLMAAASQTRYFRTGFRVW